MTADVKEPPPWAVAAAEGEEMDVFSLKILDFLLSLSHSHSIRLRYPEW